MRDSNTAPFLYENLTTEGLIRGGGPYIPLWNMTPLPSLYNEPFRSYEMEMKI